MGYATYVAHDKHMAKGKKLPDTIYMLTDGKPTDASGDEEYDAMHLALYPGNSVRMHTICIGRESEMLKTIAEEHGGKYVLIETRKVAKKEKQDKKKDKEDKKTNRKK